MANSMVEMSSDDAQGLGGEYQVFLSFRGLDTRHGFTDFLYHGLVDAGVRVFRDEDELRVGEVIGGNLLRAINNSMIYIPIFSRTYASSKWCLRELAHIVDNVSQSNGKKSILPIFLDVEPEDVKLKTPRYSDPLLEHANKFPDEVKAWRKALAEVDEIKGWNMKKDQSQAEIVQLVVKEVLEKLKLKQKPVPEQLVGLDDRVKHLIELLDVNHLDVRLIGIYGMGGIGKTTVAKVVFNKLTSHFGKYCSFLEDIRESMSTKDGIIQLQKKLLSNIVGSESAEEVYDSEQGMERIKGIFRTKKVLLVLDDVDNKEHIKKLIGHKPLHSGSRIIITTRNTTIMEGGTIISYEMLKMEDALALQLFCRHAFGRDYPSNDYHGLSSEIVRSTGGLPLAIEVIGSSLNQKDKAFWEETLVRLRNVPEEEIQKKLKISYDALDKFQKEIFLDIACFLFNEEKTDAVHMWADCRFYPERGIHVLTSRCLIKILNNNKFSIHDQLIDMGREIVRQESPIDLGKQSRLWIAKEALEIIRTKTRKDEVQALEINVQDGFIEIANEEFERLPNLRFLNLSNGTFAGNFSRCHSKLRWISWCSPHQDFRADNMYLDHLLVFKLDGNHFTDDSKAWDLIKRAHRLKVLSLTDCRGITTIPDFSKCLGLEKLTLARCFNVKKIKSFIGDLQSLIKLEIVDCIGLTYLPEEVGAIVKLKRFSLKGCSGLRELPSSLGNLTSLIELDLLKTRIRELPNSIGKLKSLRTLRFAKFDHRENHAWQFPSGISTLVNLEELDLSWHNVTGEIPVGIGELSFLKILNLIATSISGVPRTINKLDLLQTLNLRGCHSIQVLPELPTSLTVLLVESRSLLSISNLSNLTNLVGLQLSDGSKATGKSNLLPGCNLRWIWRFDSLKSLRLNLLNVPAPPELARLSHVEGLGLHNLDLETLGQLPSSLLRLDLQFSSIGWAESLLLKNLSTLEFYRCEVEDIPLEGLPRLKKLTVDDCKRLQRLSIPSALREIRRVEVSNCSQLDEIKVVGLLESLEHLRVDECESLKRISGLSYLKNQEALILQGCNELANVEGLDELESLKSLEVRMCPSLRWLIDAFCTKIPDNCSINTKWCGDSIKDFEMSLKDYKKIIQNTSNEVGHPFTIIFVLGVKKHSDGSGFVGGTEREIENATPGSVTYEGLVADAKGFGFRLKRMWCKAPGGDRVSLVRIKSDKQVNGMVPLASKRGFVHLYVEGRFDSEPSKATNQVEDRKYLSSLERPFTIIFHLGVKNPSGRLEFVGGIKREKENVTPDSVTYEGLIADIKGFGFRLKRMWCETLVGYCDLLIEIKSDEQVKGMVQLASKRRSMHLYIEGGVDSEWKGEYDDEMMEMLKEDWAMKIDVYSDEDGPEWDVPSPDEDSDSASVSESETDGTSSIDDFQSEPGNAECFEAIGNRSQMRDERIGHSSNVNGGKTTSMENRNKENDESGEPVDQNDSRLSCQSCKGVEHHESSCKATTEVEDEGDLSSVKRDRTVETDRIPTKTGRGNGTGHASNPGRDPVERVRGRVVASSSRNGNGSRSGKDAASTSEKGKASNSGRSISSISQSSATLSSGRGRGSISGNGTTSSSGRDTILSLGRGRGSSSRKDTTNMGASSSSGRGIASSSRSGSTLSTGRGRGSTSGRGTTVNLGRGATVSLGRGTTEMGVSLRSGTNKGFKLGQD